MQIGAIFPQTEIGADPGAIREYAQAAEALGYSHLFVADHVLGADARRHAHVAGSYYTHRSVIHESFTLLGYLAAITEQIGLTTGILILPQRATALVAKQAAEVDVLSRGRLRLGVGVGWNHVEYEALNRNFHDRGRRSEEQIALLRALWTQEVVDFNGRWHQVSAAGINPLPVQRPIPVWLGAGSSGSPLPPEPVLRRIATISDGWFPNFPPAAPGGKPSQLCGSMSGTPGGSRLPWALRAASALTASHRRIGWTKPKLGRRWTPLPSPWRPGAAD